MSSTVDKQRRRLEKKLLRLNASTAGESMEESKASTGRVSALTKISKLSERIVSNVLDPFQSYYETDALVPPLYDPAALSQMSITCDILSQCVKAFQVNCNGMGYHLEFDPPEDNPDQEESEADKAEKRKLDFLFRYPNAQQTWIQLKDLILADELTTGRGYLEVVRNLMDDIAELHYAQAKTIRMTKPDGNATEHIQWARDGGEWIKITRFTRFRRYCQIVNDKKVWFKQFGDPRSLNKKTGVFAEDSARWPFEIEASELIQFGNESPNSPYGEPPWISELINIMGSAEAKKINYLYFNDKTIPPYIITVAGGTLGPEATRDLKEFLENDFKGSDNFHKVLLLEAIPVANGPVGDEKGPAVRIDVKPMTQFMQEDALFQVYIKNNAKAVRESFRLPPLLVGASEDYSHASVHEAKIVAEQQVFSPQRNAGDEQVDRTIIADFGTKSYKMRSHGTPLSDDTQVISALGVMIDIVPVGHAVDFISELMGKEPPDMKPEERSMTVAQYKAQFTPKLDLGTFGDEPGDDGAPSEETKELLTRLKAIKSAIEKRHS